MIILLTSLSAHAWDHTGFVWEVQASPLQVVVDPTMPDADEWLAAFQAAADAWDATPTALVLSVEMAGSGPLSGQSSPGRILVLSDVEGWAGDGVPAITVWYPTGEVAYDTRQGSYLYVEEADIRIGDEAFVGIDEPCEADENIREIVATHELGHALGMDHSCEEHNTFCEEPELSAVMYWDDRGCTANETLNADDLEGLGWLYDAAGYVSVTSGDQSAKTPREMCFETEPNAIPADHVEWDFGDGGTAEGDETCHTFETPGEYEVEASYFSEPDDDVPRSWSDTILACPTPPGPMAGAEHLFEVDTIGTQIEIRPTVDMLCVTSLRWSVLRGDETLFEQPTSMSLVDVGDYGEYAVVLEVTGFGGVTEEEQTVTLAAPEADEKSGCSTVHPRGGLALLSLLVAAVGTGRRATRPERGHGARNSSCSRAR